MPSLCRADIALTRTNYFPRLCGDRLKDAIQKSGVSQERIASISKKLAPVKHDDAKQLNVQKVDVESEEALDKELNAIVKFLKDDDWNKRADGLQ